MFDKKRIAHSEKECKGKSCNLHKTNGVTLPIINNLSFIRKTTIKPLNFQKLVLFVTLYITL